MYSVRGKRRRGVGDFTAPSCTPGEKGCVPHWYCYIPGMATPDCWKSFVTGTGELVSGAGEAVGTVARATVENAVSGFFQGALPSAPSSGGGQVNWALWIGLGLAGVFMVMTLAQPGARRYGR